MTNVKFFVIACACASSIVLMAFITQQSDCPPGINKMPMYGKAKKCAAQLESDRKFLQFCDKQFPNRKEASAYHAGRGWDYVNKNVTDTAMMRFNQAWLLDSLNAEAYWGFANVLCMRDQKFEESLKYFKVSLRLDPSNPNVWHDASSSYGYLFHSTKDQAMLEESIHHLRKAISLDRKNARAYAQLTAAFCYYVQKDSAKKYLKITDSIDPSAINPQVRKLLSKE